MPDRTSFISQIQQEEAEAAKLLSKMEEENDQRLQRAAEEADMIVQKAESEEREAGNSLIAKTKDEAKAKYGNLMADADNVRRDIIENGKLKISSGRKKVVEDFISMFD